VSYPARLLGEDEHVVLETRPHWRSLIVPAIVLIVVVGIGSFLASKVGSGSVGSAVRWVIVAAGLVIVVIWSVIPFVQWLSATYVFTNRRIITRSGVLVRRGRDMPLSKVNDVSFRVGAIERLFNCGTLVVESAGERGQLLLANVPDVENLQREIYRLHEEDDEYRRSHGVSGDVPAGDS
jgi:uncharacterized membrane protein YdbT with pleckstrin-like domain